jgi:hypothetical protein
MPGTRVLWSPEEDELLTKLITDHKAIVWESIAERFRPKTPSQVKDRWLKVLDPSLHRGLWTLEEDDIIRKYVSEHGTQSWSKLAELLPGRLGKQCRERWVNILDPSLTKGPWTGDEDWALSSLHKKLGNQWAKIAALIPGRSPNDVKNRWHVMVAQWMPQDRVTTKVRLPSIFYFFPPQVFP